MLTLYFRETDVGVVHRVQDGALVRRRAPPVRDGARPSSPSATPGTGPRTSSTPRARTSDSSTRSNSCAAPSPTSWRPRPRTRSCAGCSTSAQSPIFPDKAGLVPARVIARSTTVWYSTVTIDAGSDDGVQVYDAVVNGQGLVGRIESVKATTSPGPADHRPAELRRRDGAAGAGAGRARRQRDRRPLAAVRRQGRGGQGRPVHRDVGDGRAPCSRAASRSARSSECLAQEVELYQVITVQPFVDLRKLDLVFVVKR